MKLTDKLGTVLWNIILILLMLPTSFLAAKVGVLFTKCSPQSKRVAGGFARVVLVITCLIWRLATCLSCWIRIRVSGLREFRSELGSSGRACVILSNHVSFLDTIFAVSFMPLSQVGRVKMLVADRIFKIPLVGTIARSMGHISTPPKELLKAEDYDRWLQVCQTAVEEHIVQGGIAAWFPEGKMNFGDPETLMDFKAGGLAIAVRHDVEIWCLASVGNSVCWPRSAPAGGRPCHIGYRIFRLCESSHSFLASVGDSERGRAVYLANQAQERVQASMDALIAEGYVGSLRAADAAKPLLASTSGP